MYSLLSLLSGFIRLPPGKQALMNMAIPLCGLLFFNWMPAAVLVFFGVELLNYWLCNTVLLLLFVRNESIMQRVKNTFFFSLFFLLSIGGFCLLIVLLTGKNIAELLNSISQLQFLFIVSLYLLQFIIYLLVAKPAGKVTTVAIKREVYYRLTLTYFLFICYAILFAFFAGSVTMGYVLAFILIFSKSLVDYILMKDQSWKNIKEGDSGNWKDIKLRYQKIRKERDEKKASK